MDHCANGARKPIPDSVFRRKNNTYAKSKENLQRTLDVFWLIPDGVTTKLQG
jgi:hypothetical protein